VPVVVELLGGFDGAQPARPRPAAVIPVRAKNERREKLSAI